MLNWFIDKFDSYLPYRLHFDQTQWKMRYLPKIYMDLSYPFDKWRSNTQTVLVHRFIENCIHESQRSPKLYHPKQSIVLRLLMHLHYLQQLEQLQFPSNVPLYLQFVLSVSKLHINVIFYLAEPYFAGLKKSQLLTMFKTFTLSSLRSFWIWFCTVKETRNDVFEKLLP